MTEEKTERTFTQDEVDELVKSRLARAREQWEKESGAEELKAELEQVRADHHRDAAQRAVKEHLKSIGVADEGRQSRILKHVDLGEVSLDDRSTVTQALVSVRNDMPELFEGRRVAGAGSGGSEKPVLEPEKPLTREELAQMDPQEVNSQWDRVRKFLAGERGV